MKKRFIIDNDGTNIFMLKKPLNDEDLEWAIKQCPKSVTTYMVCPNAIGKFYYPCSVGETISREMAPYLIEAFDRGEDPFGKFLQMLKQSGKEVFITYRMNDAHNANEPSHWGASEFRKKHPEFAVDVDAIKNNRADWMSYCLDYSQQAVQDYILSSITDLASKYDVDGFQLDWMRFPRHLSGDAWLKRDALTNFVMSVRSMLDEIGNNRGKKILLSARVPTWLDGCKSLGIELEKWAKIIDFITPAPFLSCDYHIDFNAFRKALSENPIPIYAGTDMNHSGRCHTSESYRAWALSMYAQGADGLNLFNFPCWTEYLAEQPFDWIADLDDIEKIKNKPALYTLVNNFYRVANVDQPTPLPIIIESGKSANLNFYIPEFSLPPSRALFLIASSGDFTFSVNDNDLIFPRKVASGNIFLMFTDQDVLNREPKVDQCRTYIISPEKLKSDNSLAILNKSAENITISRLDLGLWF